MIDLCQWRVRIGAWNCCDLQLRRGVRIRKNRPLKEKKHGVIDLISGTKSFTSLIFILSLLLILSGDIEINPGPATLLDKPKKEELLDLLVSIGTAWEPFVLCLPGVTEELITELKKRDLDSPESAFVQQWLEGPDASWKEVMIALLKTNETILAYRTLRHLVENTEGAVEAKKVRRILEDVLRTRFSDLSKATKKCISEIAADMYSKSLISETVKDSPNYNDVIHEFVADMSFKNNVLALEDHCRLFLDCLINGGGPAKQAAYCLAKDWEQGVLTKANISLCLHKEDIPKNISKEIIPLSSEDQVAKDLQNLQRKFVPLLTNIRNYFGELVKSGRFEVVNIARWAAEYTDETGLTQITTIDELFDKIHGRYHFLDCELIEELVEQFPPDIKLQTEVEEYIKNLNYLRSLLN